MSKSVSKVEIKARRAQGEEDLAVAIDLAFNEGHMTKKQIIKYVKLTLKNIKEG